MLPLECQSLLLTLNFRRKLRKLDYLVTLDIQFPFKTSFTCLEFQRKKIS